jgi:hypothetical protein
MTHASLRERLGDRVGCAEIDKVSEGAPARLFLRFSSFTPNTADAALALGRRHVPLGRALEAMTRLAMGANCHLIDAPMVENADRLVGDLAECGVEADPVE